MKQHVVRNYDEYKNVPLGEKNREVINAFCFEN
jgi:hypothetical protein